METNDRVLWTRPAYTTMNFIPMEKKGRYIRKINHTYKHRSKDEEDMCLVLLDGNRNPSRVALCDIKKIKE